MNLLKNNFLYQGLYEDPTTKHTKFANSAIEIIKKIEHALNTFKEEKITGRKCL